ncbi:MAG TPA: hypothetical protein VK574_08485 [Terracidiphilus sp.]|nr:hypothetical protein [Terracidiphilus sp.]
MKLVVLVAPACLFFAKPTSTFGQVGFAVNTPEGAPASKPASVGQVSGSVICGDTDQPGLFAGVQPLTLKSDALGLVLSVPEMPTKAAAAN